MLRWMDGLGNIYRMSVQRSRHRFAHAALAGALALLTAAGLHPAMAEPDCGPAVRPPTLPDLSKARKGKRPRMPGMRKEAGEDIPITGDTREEHAAGIRKFFKRRFGQVDQSRHGYQAIEEHLLNMVWPKEDGTKHVWHRAVYYVGISFNQLQDMGDSIDALDAPKEYRDALEYYYAQGFVHSRWRVDRAYEHKRIASAPKSGTMVAPDDSGSILRTLTARFPELKDLPPYARKAVMDKIAYINPWVDPVGYRVLNKAGVKDDGDDLLVPLGHGKMQACVYECPPPYKLYIPDKQTLMAYAAPEKLDLRGSWISDLSVLSGVSPVELNISRTKVKDLSPVRSLPRLRRLYAAGLDIRDVNVLKGLKLTHLDIAQTRVRDLAPLQGMPLQLLNISHTLVSDFAVLKGMPLSNLGVAYLDIKDLALLKGMPLTVLNLEATGVSSLEPLCGMKLTRLNIDWTRVTDLTPLKGAPIRLLECDPHRKFAGLSIVRDMPLVEFQYQSGKEWRAKYDATPEGRRKRGAAPSQDKTTDDVEDLFDD